MKIVVLLGNLGKEYVGTRHNIAWDSCSFLDKTLWVRDKKLHAFLYQDVEKNKDFLWIKPDTMMNLSGKSVCSIVNWYKISPEDILVVYDDIALEVGKIKVSYNKNHGNHNGLRSIEDCLGTRKFSRVRIGIGKPDQNIPLRDHVLKKFKDSEVQVLETLKVSIEKIIRFWVQQDIQKTMNEFN